MSGASDAQGDDESEAAEDRPDGERGSDAASDGSPDDGVPTDDGVPAEAARGEGSGTDETDETDVVALREQVEEQYDFENFGPNDMAKMSAEEWEAAFDHETWITGEELLDRVEADLRQRVADRDVFARLERRDDSLVAYSDTGYATVYADGSVEGRGTVLRDVKPTVALCSMESYDVPENPPAESLPKPQEVPEGSGALGNTVLQVVAGFQVLAGVVLVGAWLLISLQVIAPPGGGSVRSLNVVGMLVAGVLFVAIGVLLFAVVANARLSDKFRAEEYRNRLRAVDLESGERPEFLPEEGPGGEGADRNSARGDDLPERAAGRGAAADRNRTADGDSGEAPPDADRAERSE